MYNFSHSDMDKLQWGNRKRFLCVKGKSDCDGGGGSSGVMKRKITSKKIFSHSDLDKLQWDWGNTKRLLCVKSQNPCIIETRVCSRKNIKLREDSSIDQFSKVPDELLVCILSCMSVKEAAASSILSRRWRYLWTFISKLDFDGSYLWTALKSNPDFDNLESKQAAFILKYVGWVDNVLRLRDKQPTAVEELRISSSLDKTHQSYIDRWIGFALAKEVVRLDLNLAKTSLASHDLNYTFPYKLLCGSESHSWGFKGLRFIRMVYVTMSDGALEIFVRSCPHLEEIFFAKCHGFSTVQIVNPFPALKRLTLVCCFHLESIEVHDSNLEYFMYRGPMLQRFILKNVPLLVEMNVGGLVTMKVEEFLKMFSSYLPQLEKLTIDKWQKLSITEARLICSSVKMINLKRLVWKFVGSNGDVYGSNLMPLAILIGALPLLQRLVLMTHGDREKAVVGVSPQEKRRKMSFIYSHLKQVEFVGYHGVTSEFEILAHILENAGALEEVIIHPAKGMYDVPVKEYTKQDVDAFRACAKAQLTTRVPSRATLKIL